MNTFELGKSDWFEVDLFEENSFLNDKLDNFDYGKWYSVKFKDDADTFLWQTKTEPIENEKYWGFLEKTKSGKATKFKWDKQNAPANLPSGEPSTYTKQQTKTSHDITLGMVWKVVAGIRGLPEDDEEFAKFFEIVDAHLNELVIMSAKLNSVSARSSGAGDPLGNSPSVPQQRSQLKEERADPPTPATARAPIHDKLTKGFGKAVPANEDDELDYVDEDYRE